MRIKLNLSLTGLLLAISAIVSLSFTNATAQALRYCDDNSIIRCGALTASELQQKYNANEGDVKAIFSHYGISSSMVANAGSAKIGTVKKNGEVVVDGKVVATSAQTVGRHNVSGSTAVTINGKTYYQRTPADVFVVDSQQAFVFLDSNGKFIAAILQPCGNPIVATPKEQPKPTPKYTCDGLTVSPISRTRYEFKATRTVQNAEYVHTTFVVRDNTGKEVARTNDTDGVLAYDQTTADTYSVEALIVVKVDGQTKTTPSTAACKKSFTVKEAPAYECVSIEKIKKSRTTYEFRVETNVKNGATVKQISVDFGDGQSQIINSGETATHTYAEADTYTIVATPTFVVDGKDVTETDKACETELTIEAEECKPGIPKGDDRCEEVLGETTPPPAEETPPIIAETGPAALLGGLVGSSALGLGISSYARSRRALKDAALRS